MTFTFSDWKAGVAQPQGWDCADAVDDGWTGADLDAFLRATVTVWKPKAAEVAKQVENPPAPSSNVIELHRPERPSARLITDDALALDLGTSGWDENARFVPAWGDWLFWNHDLWKKADYVTSRGRVRDFLREQAVDIWNEAVRQARATDDSGAKRILDMAKKEVTALGSQSTITAVEQVARTNWQSAAAAEDFDADPLLLGTPGGTVDLRTGVLRDAERSDMITKATAVTPARLGADAPAWGDFLEAIFPGDPDLVSFMQRVAGYALTGETREHKLFFLHGAGRNGKGTFVQTLTDVFGAYARTVGSSLFMAKNSQEHPTGIAQLRGHRLVASNEIPKGATWDEEIIKTLTGGDIISARHMRQDFFEFKPQLSLLISGNNKPRFKGVGTAMRERFILIPFTQSFTDANGQRDPHLADKLKEEWPAILRWAIEGAVDWQRAGLRPPASVVAASADYLDDEDDVLTFVREELEPDPSAKTSVSQVYDHFRKWQESQGVKAIWTQTAMTRAMGEEGNLEIKKSRPASGGGVERCIIGYRLKTVSERHQAEYEEPW